MPVKPPMNKAIVEFINKVQLLTLEKLTMAFRNDIRVQRNLNAIPNAKQFLFFSANLPHVRQGAAGPTLNPIHRMTASQDELIQPFVMISFYGDQVTYFQQLFYTIIHVFET